jgi:hypothetical protein
MEHRKMKVILSFLTIIGLLITFSGIHAAEQSLHAHEHGAIKLEMVVDKNNIEIDLDGPAESFLGYEYLPKSDKEKEIFNRHQLTWNNKLFSLITFDQKVKCVVKDARFKQVIDKEESPVAKMVNKKEQGVHSDIEASAKLKCALNLSGVEVTISLRKVFPKIKKLLVEIIGNEALSVEIIKDIQTFKIK